MVTIKFASSTWLPELISLKNQFKIGIIKFNSSDVSGVNKSFILCWSNTSSKKKILVAAIIVGFFSCW